ncbi:hypothetical protein [Streptomyces sp. bgisy153]|uniref:hypothetical protein n=1 Tax=Streptomyces sp. bgisy153 TaxID=3413793 RepID=UPI003D73DF5E
MMSPTLAALITYTWSAQYDPQPHVGRLTLAHTVIRRERPHLYAPQVPETFRGPKWGQR